MRNLKRLLCLTLVAIMLTTSVSAVVVPGGGINVVGPSSGKDTDYSLLPYVGVAVGLQQMSGGDFTIDVPENPDDRGSSKGLAKVVEHFAYSYPDPSHVNGAQGSVYVLPDAGHTPRYAAATGNGVGQDPLQSWMYASAGSNVGNNWGEKLYAAAAKNVTNKMPSPNLAPDTFGNLFSIRDVSADEAKKVVAFIFGSTGSTVDQAQMVSRFNKYYEQGIDPGQEGQEVRYICNYAGLMMYIARCLPEANWPMYESFLNDFVGNSTNGKKYNPTVITVELCMPFEHKGNKKYETWRTVPEQIAIQTGMDEGTIRNASAIKSARDEIANNTYKMNPATAIINGASAETKFSTLSLGGMYMLGWTGKGDVGTSYCRNVTTVSKGALDEARDKWGLALPKEGLWGAGIFGIDDNMKPVPPPPPVFDGNIWPAGTISIDVQKPSYTVPVGHYNQQVGVTLTINLSASGQALEDGTVKEDWPNLAATLRWMQKNNAPLPTISIWLKQAKPIAAQNEAYHDGLISVIEPVASDTAGVEGGKLAWEDLTHTLNNVGQEMPGVKVLQSGSANAPVIITFTDYAQAIKMCNAKGDLVIQLKTKANLEGDLASTSDKLEHYFKVGASATVGVPVSLDKLDEVRTVSAGLRTVPKYDWTLIGAEPAKDKPSYFSQELPNFSELKQGTVPASGGGSSEKFNSMTGTPTFTDTSGRTDFTGTPYENAGKYYQYFAVGGSEFVVEFEGEYVQNQTASRNFTANFSTSTCDKSTLPCNNHQHGCSSEIIGSTGGENPQPIYGCTNPCSPQTHMSSHPHTVTTNTVNWSVQYTGLCYIKITSAKVWQLSEARLDGTRELLDTNYVTASVKNTAPSIFYNRADSNTSAAGRMVYDYLPNGAGAGGNADHLVWNFSTPAACSGSFEKTNLQKVQDIIKNTAAATMVSDFLVLRTSNGDQSILYYEYRAGEGTTLAASAATSTTSPTIGNTPASITLSGGAQATGVKFENRTYQQLWDGNYQTSKGGNIQPTEITYGGYNGKYQDVTTKYKSSGHASNINLESTAACKNASGVFKPPAKPASVFRLLNDTLIIADTKPNGEYKVGEATVFYKNILNYGTPKPNHQIVKCRDFGNQMGFTVKAPYSPNHMKTNDVVVYNPVSVQNVLIASLPDERDQRTAAFDDHETIKVEITGACPGDETCAYMKLDCSVAQHVHTEACFATQSYDIHSGNNTHTHTSACGSGRYKWYHNGHPLSNPRWWSGTEGHIDGVFYCDYGDAHGGSSCNTTGFTKELGYTCSNLPLNTHVCTSGVSGSMTPGQSLPYSYTGGLQQVTLAPGTYKLEVWGAQGGENGNTGLGGLGGYAAGEVTLTQQTTLTLAIGGKGGGSSSTGWWTNQGTGGYNGGGAPGRDTDGNDNGRNEMGGGGGGYTTIKNGSSALVTGGGGGGRTYNNTPGGRGTGGSGGGSHSSTGSAGTLADSGGQAIGGVMAAGSETYKATGWYNTSGVTKGALSESVNSGNGAAKITYIAATSTDCRTVNTSFLSCADPHHANNYNWKLYTAGLQHKSEKVCTGRNCADTSDITFPDGAKYTQAQLAAGHIVYHTNGEVHLSTDSSKCTFCGDSVNQLLAGAQNFDRTPANNEWSHGAYGGTCWKACGNDAAHNKYVDKITSGDVTYELAEFIQLDWGFQLYFPNTGDFYGTGAKASGTTTAERGWGYINDMDATEWTEVKWVKFPFAVIYNNTTFLANERIYLSVPETLFDFYLPLHNAEVAQAKIEYGTVAINTQIGNELDCAQNATQNIAQTTYQGRQFSHRHSAHKSQYIDVIGRIGNLTLEDTGDFRFANFFKQTAPGWIVDNVVRKVDPTKQNNLVLDATDVRMVPITSTGVMANTHGMRPERGVAGKLYKFPLTPISNNIGALNKQPVRVGYNSYLDLTTLGNYYGIEGSQKVQIQPYYYRLDLDSGAWEPVDVYMDNNGSKVLINCFGDATKGANSASTQVNMDWVAESARRNYNGKEVTMSNQVVATYPWTYLPSGSSLAYGNYNVLNLTQRNRTFVGSEYTYGWHKDPSNRLAEVAAGLQGGRWHFNIGLPSSATFVRHGQSPTQANIDACKGNAVVVCALEIFAKGEVWTLKYTGENINVPFKVTGAYPDKTYNPNAPGGPGKDKPIAIVYSIDKSSKQDLGTTGNQ